MYFGSPVKSIVLLPLLVMFITHVLSLYMKIAVWRRKLLSNKTSLILTAALIGLLASCCAVILKNGVHFIRLWVIQPVAHVPLILFISPVIGIFLTVVFTRVVLKGQLSGGVTNIIYCIVRRDSNVERHKLYSQMFTSILTVGFGGSAGLEAPSAATGSAIGSHLANLLGFNHKERTLLLACGAAAGISAVFNAPIAGVVFAFEILLVDTPLPAVVPLLISSATAALLSPLIASEQPFVLITQPWHSGHLFHYVLFAVLAAFLSVYAIRAYFYFGGLMTHLGRPYIRAIIGGLLVGCLIFLFPPLYGEGYESVVTLLQQKPGELLAGSLVSGTSSTWVPIVFILLVMFLKVIATSFTVGSGGNGGMFGSSLFTGAMCGYAFAHTLNVLGLAHLNEVNFVVIGMAALMSGIIHTPLTAIFLIAEITGGYALFVPLMLVSSVSFLISHYFEPFSVYTKKLALSGDLPASVKDHYILAKMRIENYIIKSPVILHKTDTLTQATDAFYKQEADIFPVLDSENKLLGVVDLSNFKKLLFSPGYYPSNSVEDVMAQPKVTIDVTDSMESLLKKFDETNALTAVVLKQGVFEGFVSKSAIYTDYRRRLIREAEISA